VIGLLAYAALLAALVVRLGAGDGPPRETRPLRGEPLWMTRLHHRLFAVVLLGAPVERLLVDTPSRGRVAGLVLFAGGVVLYRLAGRTLGDALSPFIGSHALAHAFSDYARYAAQTKRLLPFLS